VGGHADPDAEKDGRGYSSVFTDLQRTRYHSCRGVGLVTDMLVPKHNQFAPVKLRSPAPPRRNPKKTVRRNDPDGGRTRWKGFITSQKTQQRTQLRTQERTQQWATETPFPTILFVSELGWLAAHMKWPESQGLRLPTTLRAVTWVSRVIKATKATILCVCAYVQKPNVANFSAPPRHHPAAN